MMCFSYDRGWSSLSIVGRWEVSWGRRSAAEDLGGEGGHARGPKCACVPPRVRPGFVHPYCLGYSAMYERVLHDAGGSVLWVESGVGKGWGRGEGMSDVEDGCS
jgi:hypothetical protein